MELSPITIIERWAACGGHKIDIKPTDNGHSIQGTLKRYADYLWIQDTVKGNPHILNQVAIQ